MINDCYDLIKSKVLYISQSGTSGYANAAKGHVYDLIKKKINVKWVTFETDSTNTTETSDFDSYISKCKKNIIMDVDCLIVHSTPDLWKSLLTKEHTDGVKTIVGRTVWEFEKLIPEWVDIINNSIVDYVSVPTEWNKQNFINSGVTKPILVDPHVYVDFPYSRHTIEHFFTDKSVVFCNSLIDIENIKNTYKFYTIGQFADRKGIRETIEMFCKTFTRDDGVALFVKTFRENYSEQEQNKCIETIFSIIKDSNNIAYAPIILIKENLSYDEMHSLHDLCDCYVQFPRTEGFGLGIFDAYKKNKNIVVTGYGGHVEYLKKNYAGLVAYDLQDLDNQTFPNYDLDNTYKWAITDKKSAYDKLNAALQRFQPISLKKVSPSILYIGQYGTSGYASAAKQYIADYVLKGIPVTWQPLKFDTSELHDDCYVNILAKSAINRKIQYDTVILHCTPDLWKRYITENDNVWKNKKIIGYTVWETNRLKPEWVDAINSVHEVWCPSTYNERCFIESGVIIPIKVVPHLFYKKKLPTESKIRELDDDRYTFYNISELNHRKNVLEMVDSFCAEFTYDDSVQLLLKLHYKDHSAANKEHCKNQIDGILSKYSNPPKVVVICDSLNEDRLLALHAHGDCYVSLTRSEGFGLTIFDAYNYGKRVIVTGYGGQLDYLGVQYSGLVNYTLVDVNNMESFNGNYNHSDQLWAQPDVQHFRKLIRNCYENQL